MLPEPFRPRPLAGLLACDRDPYAARFARRLRAIHPALPDQIGRAADLGSQVVDDLIACGLSFACQAQNFMNIELGRATLVEMPRPPVLARIGAIASRILDLSEEYEVRRLLEVVALLDVGALREVAAEFRRSEDPEIRDAADEILRLAGAS